jgi:hypothetical protein
MPPARPSSVAAVPWASRDANSAIEAFLGEFGATRDRPAVFRDASGTRVVISRDLFLNADGEVLRNARRLESLAQLAEAVKDPDEIWVDWAETPDGNLRLRRRYLRRFAGAVAGLAVLEWTDAGWFGTALLLARATAYLEKQRSGALVYQRGQRETPWKPSAPYSAASVTR